MRLARRAALVSSFAVATMASRPSHAARDACGDDTRPYIVAAIALESDPKVDSNDFLAQLKPSLQARGIDVCDRDMGRASPAVAQLRLLPAPSRATTIVIEVSDALTRKRVVRSVDLSAVPADGRALALAVSADELLRAAWAELILKDAPEPDRPVPDVVRDSVASSMKPPPPATTPPAQVPRPLPVAVLTLRGQADAFSGGLVLLGGDLGAAFWVSERFGITLAGGYRMSPITAAASGSVQTSALRGSLGGTFAITSRARRAGIDLGLSFEAWRIHFEPRAMPGVHSLAANDLSITTTASLGGWVALGSWLRLSAGLGGVVPLRASAATSDGTTLTANSGVGFAGSLGFGVAL